MKAWVLKAKGQFELEEVEKPQAGQGKLSLRLRLQEYVVQIFLESIKMGLTRCL